MSWNTNFDEILSANGVTPRTASPVAAPAAAPVVTIDPDTRRASLFNAFRALPDFEQHVGTMTTLGLRDEGVLAYMENLLAASPKGQEFANAEALHQQAVASGQTLIDNVDRERAVAAARSTAAQMMAAGAGDRAILQAVSNQPGVNLETQSAVQAAAQGVIDTDKFNLFSTRNNEPAVGAPLANFAAVATTATANVLDRNAQDRNSNVPMLDFAEAERRLRDTYRTNSGPVPGIPAFATVDTVNAAPMNHLSIADALDFVRDSGPGATPGGRGNPGPVRGGGNGLG